MTSSFGDLVSKFSLNDRWLAENGLSAAFWFELSFKSLSTGSLDPVVDGVRF